MDESSGGDDRGSRGFAYTRRELLAASAAFGTASAVAGCGGEGIDIGSDDPTPTQVDPGSKQVDEDGLVDDGLTVLESALVEDPRRVEIQSDLDRQVKTTRFVRVRVRNDTDERISVVSLSVDLFDDQGGFLEVQMATIHQLRPAEVFEGFVPFAHPDASLYLIRARRSRRASPLQSLPNVSVSDHCLDDEAVRGTVTHSGTDTAEQLNVEVTFYDAAGDALGVSSDTVVDLGGGESAAFEADLEPVIEQQSTPVTDYSVAVGSYGPGVMDTR